VPLFSIIIPTYNREHLVRRTLESVFAQSFTDFEVIVVDDGSTDATLDVVATFGDRVKILKQANQGPGLARNLGARHATGQYLAFLDSDDLWFPWTLRFFAQTIKQHNFPALISGNPLPFVSESDLAAVTESPAHVDQYADYFASPYRQVCPSACAMLVTSQAFNTVNGFAKEWVNGEDSELFIRLGEQPNFICVRAPWTVGYRTTPGSLIGNLDRTFAGREFMIRRERAGFYPGGAARRHARIDLITSHCRSASVELLVARKLRKAISIYISTFLWNFRLHKFSYLLVFPVVALLFGLGLDALGRIALRVKTGPGTTPNAASIAAAASDSPAGHTSIPSPDSRAAAPPAPPSTSTATNL